MEGNKKSLKSIKLCIYFHTSDHGIKFEPKVALNRGTVVMPTNHKHGIRASDAGEIHFDNRTQGTLTEAIRKCLQANGIRFIDDSKRAEYRKYQKAKETGEFYTKEIKI